MHILFVTSEMAGLYKRGGLGDVSRDLPVALAKEGIDVTVVLPFYQAISSDGMKCIGQIGVEYDGKREGVFVFEKVKGSKKIKPEPRTSNLEPRILLFRHPFLDDYEHQPMTRTFAFFSLCVAHLYQYAGQTVGTTFDIIHCHDWHTALVPLLTGENNKLKFHHDAPTLEARGIKTVLTIHNHLYLGESNMTIVGEARIPKSLLHVYAKKDQQYFRFLTEGVEYADMVTTVSPTYALEIEAGNDTVLKSALNRRIERTVGILNGIDSNQWNPQTDEFLEERYDREHVIEGKKANKISLLKEIGLNDVDVPLFGFIGRIEPKQKGITLIEGAIDLLPKGSFQVAILGTGDVEEVRRLKILDAARDSIAFVNRFDEAMARRIYAASDAMLVPSKFEPCGLIQMIAMRYGTVPIVRKTGGLADSVKDGQNGFVFDEYDADKLARVMMRAIALWKDKVRWKKLIDICMDEDYSWDRSAKRYIMIYRKLIG